jgi:ribosomal protein S18 acetylase RimI-like enzyme
VSSVDSSLRSFARRDADAVVALSRHALARPGDQVGNPVWSTRADLEAELADWQPAEETLLVAEEADEIVGFGGVELPAGFEHAELFGPLVERGHQGQRLGTRILDASIESARKHGAVSVVASVGTHNASGRILLERAGFKARGRPQATYRLRQHDHRVAPEPAGSVAVRRGDPSDFDDVYALYRECFPDGRFPGDVWRTSLEAGEVYVAEADGRPAAVLNIDSHDRWIYHVGVTATERSRGIGGYLLSRGLEDYWSEHPDETLGLDVAADNVPAIRLYRRQGFAPWLVLQAYELPL